MSLDFFILISSFDFVFRFFLFGFWENIRDRDALSRNIAGCHGIENQTRFRTLNLSHCLILSTGVMHIGRHLFCLGSRDDYSKIRANRIWCWRLWTSKNDFGGDVESSSKTSGHLGSIQWFTGKIFKHWRCSEGARKGNWPMFKIPRQNSFNKTDHFARISKWKWSGGARMAIEIGNRNWQKGNDRKNGKNLDKCHTVLFVEHSFKLMEIQIFSCLLDFSKNFDDFVEMIENFNLVVFYLQVFGSRGIVFEIIHFFLILYNLLYPITPIFFTPKFWFLHCKIYTPIFFFRKLKKNFTKSKIFGVI